MHFFRFICSHSEQFANFHYRLLDTRRYELPRLQCSGTTPIDCTCMIGFTALSDLIQHDSEALKKTREPFNLEHCRISEGLRHPGCSETTNGRSPKAALRLSAFDNPERDAQRWLNVAHALSTSQHCRTTITKSIIETGRTCRVQGAAGDCDAFAT